MKIIVFWNLGLPKMAEVGVWSEEERRTGVEEGIEEEEEEEEEEEGEGEGEGEEEEEEEEEEGEGD